MAGTLANPTFVTGAKDDVAAADVYSQSSSAPINKIVDSSAGLSAAASSAKSLVGGKNMLGTVMGAVLSASSLKTAINRGGDPLSRLTSVAGPLAGVMKLLPSGVGGLAGTLLSGIKGVTGAAVQIGGITQILKSGANLSSISAVGGLLNAVNSGSFSMKDPMALIGATAGIVRGAIGSGIGAAFGRAVIHLRDNQALAQVASSVLPAITKGGDFISLQSMTNLLPAGTLKMFNPNVLNDVVQNFSLTALPKSLTTYTDVITTFGKIEPDWMTASRNDQPAVNLTVLQGASSDFSDLMETGLLTDPAATTQDKMAMFGTSFPPVSVTENLQTQFPSMVMLPTVSSQESTDPRAVAAEVNSAPIVQGPSPRVLELMSLMEARLDQWMADMFLATDAYSVAKTMKAMGNFDADKQLAKANNLRILAQDNNAVTYSDLLSEYIGLSPSWDKSRFPGSPPGTNLPTFTW